MAAARPTAVANRASAIDGATTARLVFFSTAIAWKACMMPQTVPKRPMKGEAVATMASEPRPSSTRALSRAMMESSARSMRCSRSAVAVSPAGPLARPRASRATPPAACAAARGAARPGLGRRSPPAARPESTSFSNGPRGGRGGEAHDLSMITVQDHSEAPAGPSSTTFTTESARQEDGDDGKLSGVSALWASMEGLAPFGRFAELARQGGETMARRAKSQGVSASISSRGGRRVTAPVESMQTTSTAASATNRPSRRIRWAMCMRTPRALETVRTSKASSTRAAACESRR